MPKLLKVRISSAYFALGREFILFIFTFLCTLYYLFYFHIYMCSFAVFICFISHFHIFITQQCFFHSLFRMGESDYLHDNQM